MYVDRIEVFELLVVARLHQSIDVTISFSNIVDFDVKNAMSQERLNSIINQYEAFSKLRIKTS